MRLPPAFRNENDDHILAIDIHHLDLGLNRRITMELCGCGEQINFGFLTVDADDGAIVIDAYQQVAAACIGKSDHLPGDLFIAGENLRLNSTVSVSPAKFDDRTKFPGIHGCQKRTNEPFGDTCPTSENTNFRKTGIGEFFFARFDVRMFGPCFKQTILQAVLENERSRPSRC